jgi:hypothetical protein
MTFLAVQGRVTQHMPNQKGVPTEFSMAYGRKVSEGKKDKKGKDEKYEDLKD